MWQTWVPLLAPILLPLNPPEIIPEHKARNKPRALLGITSKYTYIHKWLHVHLHFRFFRPHGKVYISMKKKMSCYLESRYKYKKYEIQLSYWFYRHRVNVSFNKVFYLLILWWKKVLLWLEIQIYGVAKMCLQTWTLQKNFCKVPILLAPTHWRRENMVVLKLQNKNHNCYESWAFSAITSI